MRVTFLLFKETVVLTCILAGVLLLGCSSGTRDETVPVSSNGGTVIVTTSQSFNAGAGGQLNLAGVALLTIPPGTADNATVELAQVKLPDMEFISAAQPDLSLLNVPRIRIKSSVPLNDGVILKIRHPGLSSLIPNGQTAVMMALLREKGDAGESLDSWEPIKGVMCDSGNAFCAFISSSLFMHENPFDPLDPVAYVTIATKVSAQGFYHLYTVKSLEDPVQEIVPGQTSITLKPTVTFGGAGSNIPPFVYPLAVDTGLGQAYAVIDSMRNGNPHGGQDLNTRDPITGERITGVPVLAAHDGAEFQPISTRDCGIGARVIDRNLTTTYCHLTSLEDIPSGKVTARDPIGRSGNTGRPASGEKLVAHLHWGVYLDGYSLAPHPFLPPQDLNKFLPYTLVMRSPDAPSCRLEAERKKVTLLGDSFFDRTIPINCLFGDFPEEGKTATVQLWMEAPNLSLAGGRHLYTWTLTTKNGFYEGVITTKGTHSAFGIHGSQPAPFTCFWDTESTWTGPVNLSASNSLGFPTGFWEIKTVATPTGSDLPTGAKCGGFTVGPYQSYLPLKVNKDQVTSGLPEFTLPNGNTGTFTFNATATDTSLTGTISTTGKGTDTFGGQFQTQETGTVNLPRVVNSPPIPTPP